MELTLLAPLDDLLRSKLVDAFSLRPLTIPRQFSEHAGSWNGRGLRMSTEVFRGTLGVEELHVASVSGAMESLTVLAWTPFSSGRRVLGIDVVAFGGSISTVVLDITPTDADLQAETILGLHRMRAQASTFSETRTWSDATPTPFSENVVFISPRNGEETKVIGLAAELIELFAQEVVSAPFPAAPAGAGLGTYLGRLSQSKKQMRVLGKLFGEEWVGPYFDEVFFNASLSAVNA